MPTVAPRSAPAARARWPNVGPRTAAALAAIGIRSMAQLRRRGAVAAYVQMKRKVPGTSLNALYALTGALEGRDWIEVRWARRLELLHALAAFEAAQGAARAPLQLRALRNIGPAMLRDLEQLGIRSVAQLARCEPDRLYIRLEKLTGKRQDPCVWDTFAAAIHQARTGEALPWWHFTGTRKQRQRDGSFAPQSARAAAAGSRAMSRPGRAGGESLSARRVG